MAFVCDITRTATLCYTLQQSFLSAYTMCGIEMDVHEIGHSFGTTNDVNKILQWHINHWTYLVKSLAETPEGDGNILDNSAIALTFEGGFGYDPEGDRHDSPHSTDNMAILLAGRAGGLKGGLHVKTDQVHPGSVLMSGMQSVGVTHPKFGDLDWKIIPELFA